MRASDRGQGAPRCGGERATQERRNQYDDCSSTVVGGDAASHPTTPMVEERSSRAVTRSTSRKPRALVGEATAVAPADQGDDGEHTRAVAPGDEAPVARPRCGGATRAERLGFRITPRMQRAGSASCCRCAPCNLPSRLRTQRTPRSWLKPATARRCACRHCSCLIKAPARCP